MTTITINVDNGKTSHALAKLLVSFLTDDATSEQLHEDSNLIDFVTEEVDSPSLKFVCKDSTNPFELTFEIGGIEKEFEDDEIPEDEDEDEEEFEEN